MSTRECDTNLNMKRIHAFKISAVNSLAKYFQNVLGSNPCYKTIFKTFQVFIHRDTRIDILFQGHGAAAYVDASRSLDQTHHSFIPRVGILYQFQFYLGLVSQTSRYSFQVYFIQVLNICIGLFLWWPVIYSANCVVIIQFIFIQLCEWFIFYFRMYCFV